MNEFILSGFILNLLQDVNILRPLIYLCHDDLSITPTLFITPSFVERDTNSLWQAEINEIKNHVAAQVVMISSDLSIWNVLNKYQGGFLMSASESDLNPHKDCHLLFRMAPKCITKITLQHGFECVGFLMNRNHEASYGRSVGFAADIICGWFPSHLQRNLRPLQKARYFFTGPTLQITRTTKRNLNIEQPLDISLPAECGIVCENLHSIRHKQIGAKTFLDQFFSFASSLELDGLAVALRPHPGGQYSKKNNIKLPENVFIDNRPSYKVDWGKYAYGISAPSSVLFDLVLNNVPAIVWQDSDKTIDITQLSFLPVAADASDMLAFACHPFLTNLSSVNQQMNSLINSSAQTYVKFLFLLGSLTGAKPFKSSTASTAVTTSGIPFARRVLGQEPQGINKDDTLFNVLIIAPNRNLPTAQICLKYPLASDPCNNIHIYDPRDFHSRDILGGLALAPVVDSLGINCVIMCRYAEDDGAQLVESFQHLGVPVVYFIDDDLLEPCPIALDPIKYKNHNSLRKQASIKRQMEIADIVYASTHNLKKQLELHGVSNRIIHTAINCSPRPAPSRLKYREALSEGRFTIGYMGFGHAADFDIAASAIRALMIDNHRIYLDLIGTVKIPEILNDFIDRITIHKPIAKYDSFLQKIRSSAWDVGLCPLVKTPFNMCKSINKWIEYSSCMIPSIGSSNTIYNDCMANECGILCDDSIDNWKSSINMLLEDRKLARRIAVNAFNSVWSNYSPSAHCLQIREVLSQASSSFYKRLARKYSW